MQVLSSDVPADPFVPPEEDVVCSTVKGNAVINITDRVHALLFGLNEDIAGELLHPLKLFCDEIEAVTPSSATNGLQTVADSSAQVIFCSADTQVVSGLRSARPDASIVVVSRHPEVN